MKRTTSRLQLRVDDTQGKHAPIFVKRYRYDVEVCPPEPKHATHDYAVLGLCVEGTVTLEQQGWWPLRAGDMLMIPAGQAHRHVARVHPVLWMVGFCTSCVQVEERAALLRPFERARAGAAPVVSLPAHRRVFVESLFAELEERLAGQDDASLLSQRSLLTLLLTELERAHAQIAHPGAADSLVAEALHFIEQNCLRPLTAADVAKHVRRSPGHVTQTLKAATGKNISEWIISGRLSEARRRLAYSDEMVDVIAERIGYADVTHMIRLFKRDAGVTPSVWRSRFRAGSS